MGYDWSKGMSVNAVASYESGEMPLSKWTKSDMLYNIRKTYGSDTEKKASKHKLSFLRCFFLEQTSWHHTSKCFNKTDFYSFVDYLEPERLEEILSMEEVKEEKETAEPETRFVLACWDEFTKERGRWHCDKVYASGKVIGNTFISVDRTKKIVSGTHFRILKDISELEAKRAYKEAHGRIKGFSDWKKASKSK